MNKMFKEIKKSQTHPLKCLIVLRLSWGSFPYWVKLGFPLKPNPGLSLNGMGDHFRASEVTS